MQLSGSEPLDDPPLDEDEPPLEDEEDEPPLDELDEVDDDELPVLPEEPPEDGVLSSSSPVAAASSSGDVGALSLLVPSELAGTEVVVVVQAIAPADARPNAKKRREVRMTAKPTRRRRRSSLRVDQREYFSGPSFHSVRSGTRAPVPDCRTALAHSSVVRRRGPNGDASEASESMRSVGVSMP